MAAVLETRCSEIAERIVSSYFSPGTSLPIVNDVAIVFQNSRRMCRRDYGGSQSIGVGGGKICFFHQPTRSEVGRAHAVGIAVRAFSQVKDSHLVDARAAGGIGGGIAPRYIRVHTVTGDIFADLID